MTPILDEDRVERAAEAMAAKRAELVHAPLARIYDELARAAITAYLGDTHVVAPKQPTDEMIKAGFKQLGWTKNTENARSDAVEVYRAMLSPTPAGKER